jgi:hypothetical protein
MEDDRGTLQRWAERLLADAARLGEAHRAMVDARELLRADATLNEEQTERCVRAIIEHEVCPDLDFDSPRLRAAIELGVIDERVAIDAVKSTGSWLLLDEFEPAVERAKSAEEAWETFQTALDMGEVALLRHVGALRKLDLTAVSALIQQRIAERAADGDEVFAVLAALVVALITDDRAQLAALDDRLVRAYGDGGALGDAAMLYGPDGEYGTYVDRRELLVERWVEVGEIAAARRWFERVLRWPSGQPVGAQLVRGGPAEQTARALRGAVTAEAWAAIEVTAREALQSRDASCSEWVDLARWASGEAAAYARERATERFEQQGDFIDPRPLSEVMQRRVSIAAAERWSGWVEEVDPDQLDRDVIGQLEARLSQHPLFDRESAEAAWPVIERLEQRCRRSSTRELRRQVACAIERCAQLGVESAIAELARWNADDPFGWSRWASRQEPLGRVADQLASVLFALPWVERQRVVEGASDLLGAEQVAALLVRHAKPEPALVRWLLAQRGWIVGEWLVEHADHPALDAADAWALLARWSSDGQCRATNCYVPCSSDGSSADWLEWAKVERRSEPSRWSWSREDTARWIREKSSGDASWLFEPGAHALVRRLRDDDEGRAQLSALFDQLVWRMRVEPRWRDRDVLAASRLAPFAKKSPLSVMAQLAARRTPREPTLDAAVILASTRWGGVFESEVRRALGADARLAQGDVVALARLACEAMGTAMAGLDSLRSLGLEVPLNELCRAVAVAIEEVEGSDPIRAWDRRWFCEATGTSASDNSLDDGTRDPRDWTRALSLERLRSIAAWGFDRMREGAVDPR